jgi:uncharacterized membrane protein YhaH (DUF805 family)
MPPYENIHLEYLIYILAGGGLLTGLLWLALKSPEWTVTFRRKSDQDYDNEVESFGEVREGRRPVPLFLMVLLGLFILWAILYTVYSGEHFPY